MLTPTPKWSLPAGNAVVPSRWQATPAGTHQRVVTSIRN